MLGICAQEPILLITACFANTTLYPFYHKGTNLYRIKTQYTNGCCEHELCFIKYIEASSDGHG